MHKSKDYLLESSKSKLDSYRLMYFISHGRLMKLENIRVLVQNDKKIILGDIEYHVYQGKDKRIRAYYADKDGKYITKSFPRIF